MLVPGWPQFYLGRKTFGRIFLFGYLSYLLLGILFIGTTPGALLLGLAIAFHASSIADVVIAHADNNESRVLYSLACLSLVALVLYLPPYHLISRVAMAQQFVVDLPPFQAGDVIIYNPSAYRQSDPQIGDIVFFHLPNMRIQRRQNRQNVFFDFIGQEVVGRVIALPGQKVTFDKGRLMINDEPSPWSQLFSARFKEGYAVTVPDNSFFILTEPGDQAFNRIPDDLWMQFSTVPRERISGRVFFRTQPLSRFGYIR
jgi:signal peptidase I